MCDGVKPVLFSRLPCSCGQVVGSHSAQNETSPLSEWRANYNSAGNHGDEYGQSGGRLPSIHIICRSDADLSFISLLLKEAMPQVVLLL